MIPIQRSAPLFGIASALVLSGCSPPSKGPAPPPSASRAEPEIPIAPVLPAPVNRAELLLAVRRAASAFATGEPNPKGLGMLAGRRFSVVLPFGCFGPDSTAELGYVYDEAKKTLRVSAKPENWLADPAIRTELASTEAEAIEGFWIERPWIVTDHCPVSTLPRPAPTQPLAATPSQTADREHFVGLAAVYEKGGSRLLPRSSRAYEVVRKTEAPSPGGYRLVLEGRIAGLEGRPIVCRATDVNQRPTCLVQVAFDRVAILSADGQLVGEWAA